MSDELPRRDATPLAEALRRWLATSGLGPRVEQAEVLTRWAELVGPQIAQVTIPESITPDGVLRVRVATAQWANELHLMTPTILARVNAGKQGRITGIRWLAGSSGQPATESQQRQVSWRKNRR
jgi:predicted nucleic acid-binding Zn ribbon protein